MSFWGAFSLLLFPVIFARSICVLSTKEIPILVSIIWENKFLCFVNRDSKCCFISGLRWDKLVVGFFKPASGIIDLVGSIYTSKSYNLVRKQ